jgi:CrcB protein
VTWVLIAVGGATGASVRYLLDGSVTRRYGGRLPWGTLVVNLLGSVLLGLLVGLDLGRGVPGWVLPLLGAGLCGSLTTTSTLAWETLALAEDGYPRRAVTYLSVSVVAGLALAGAGMAVGLRW